MFENIIMDQVFAPILIMNATWPEVGSIDPDRKILPPGAIHYLQFRGIRAITPPDRPGPRPDRGGTIFLHGHPKSPLSHISLTGVEITFGGGGTADDAARRNMPDIDDIDYRTGGYWTDDKTFGAYRRPTVCMLGTCVIFRCVTARSRCETAICARLCFVRIPRAFPSRALKANARRTFP
jgi:hypothetical protein